MIHLIQVDRDGIMSFACDEIELFTTQGATRDVFKHLATNGQTVNLCKYCMRLLAQGNVKNSRVPK